jgi:archaellum biogenesis ATPase FlaH
MLDTVILVNLIRNEDYSRIALPFIKDEYFGDEEHKYAFIKIKEYIEEYNVPPTLEAMSVAFDRGTESQRKLLGIIFDYKQENQELDWLVDQTEKFCKDKAVFNAVLEGIQIIDGKSKDKTPDALPDLLTEALQVGFDTRIGHDFIEDADKRIEYYNRVEEKIPFDIELFNKITDGGLSNKTLNIALAGTGVGKSLFMCHMSTACLKQGKRVLYITMEMAEERIAERIDANLMDITMAAVRDLAKTEERFRNKISSLNEEYEGRLLIKEYPTSSAHTGHFKALINELKLKRNFHPDIVFIDYLNICASSRIKTGSNSNSYTIIKSIAEEIRALAVDLNVPIFSATQTTRAGFGATDVSLTDTSESFGLPATADLMFAIISTDELEQNGQFMIKQLKNRYADPTFNKKFMVGVDRAKMRIFDTDQTSPALGPDEALSDSGQTDSTPVFDRGKYDDLKF